MKNYLLLLFSFFCISSFSQEICINFGDYSDDYVNWVGFDDDTYPPGSVFMENGALKVVKPEGETNYLSTGSDEFSFVGDVDIDVSEFDCPSKSLTFSLVTFVSTGVTVDGEEVSAEGESFPLFYEGDGFNCEYDGEETVVIRGGFEIVNLYGSTNVLSDLCLDCEDGVADSDCINFNGYTTPYVDSVGFDDETYPPGTVFMENGELKIIKPDGETDYIGIDDNKFLFYGDVDITVGGFDCENKVLTLRTITDIGNGLSVDGDIISDEGEAYPLTFDGDSYEYEFDGETLITIRGEFSNVSIFGSTTNMLWDVCLDCDSGTVDTDCLDFGEYSDDYVSEVGFNDEMYPPGSVFMESGDVKLVKPDGETNYLSTSEDDFSFVGDVDIDVSDSDCETKALTFSLAVFGSTGVSVDGEIVADEGEMYPDSYDGDGFHSEYDGESTVVITGDFDVVSLFGSTNILSGVCVECISTVGIEKASTLTGISIYPNPAQETVFIQLPEDLKGDFELTLVDLSGKIMRQIDASSLKSTAVHPLDLSDFQAGTYILVLKSGEKLLQTRLVKMN